ncbi:MAG: ATP-binding protein [Actinobacteria bacterium]|nr:ATP-binding protein [Actinomycetota bacterium]
MEIADDLEAVGLNATARALDELVLEATRKKQSYGDFLASVLRLELADRATKRETMLMRLAHFPQVKTLESFDFAYLPDLDPKVVAELRSLRFIKNHENLLLLGPPEALT